MDNPPIRQRPLRCDNRAKYARHEFGLTIVRRDDTMARRGVERPKPTKLRKETREWLTKQTIPNARRIARDLENEGEDVHDLLAAIDELEALLKEGSNRPKS